MVSKKMYELGNTRSMIREIFEFAKKRKIEIGEDKIFDFSLGNPTVPPPKKINETIIKLLAEKENSIHGYTSAQGDYETRKVIAKNLNKKQNTNFRAEKIYMTNGAAAALTITIGALCEKHDEFICFAPYFPEYKCFIESSGGKFLLVPPDYDSFQINFKYLEKIINKNVKAVIINSPNNPSGVIYSEETILKLTKYLKEKSTEFGTNIVIISDEPYREIVYENAKVPFITKYYENTIVCYSYSKSLSLAGERIGYILVPDEMYESDKVYAAVCGAGRSLGYVCASSLFQNVIKECDGITSDISIYEKNRNLLYNSLKRMGYECIKPQGAFYLFIKSPSGDAISFYEKCKKFDLFLVPANDFGCSDYLRISYCVDESIIRKSLIIFELMIK